MRVKRTRIGLAPVVLAVFGMAMLGGCSLADSTTLETFVTDLLRSAAAAFLL